MDRNGWELDVNSRGWFYVFRPSFHDRAYGVKDDAANFRQPGWAWNMDGVYFGEWHRIWGGYIKETNAEFRLDPFVNTHVMLYV